jgi:protein TonB
MAANAFALHEPLCEREVARWSVAAMAIASLHAAAIVIAMIWFKAAPSEEGVTLPAILVDMAPATSAPQTMPLDVAPGPVMQQADASPPEPVQQEVVEETIAPTPPQEKPEVAAPTEQKKEAPARPEPAKIVPVEKQPIEKPKVVRPDAKRRSDAVPAPRTTAPPRAEREAPLASAMSAGATASAIASYNQRVRAHLMRFHQYPSAGGGQRGVVRLNFTLGRSGQLLSSRLGGSSGVVAFDAQAMAMVRQAQPFPPFPAELTSGSMSFTIPVEFTVR